MKITTLTELSAFIEPYRELYASDTEKAYYELQALARSLPLPKFVVAKQTRQTYTIDVQEHPKEKLSAKIYNADGQILNEFCQLPLPLG